MDLYILLFILSYIFLWCEELRDLGRHGLCVHVMDLNTHVCVCVSHTCHTHMTASQFTTSLFTTSLFTTIFTKLFDTRFTTVFATLFTTHITAHITAHIHPLEAALHVQKLRVLIVYYTIYYTIYYKNHYTHHLEAAHNVQKLRGRSVNRDLVKR